MFDQGKAYRKRGRKKKCIKGIRTRKDRMGVRVGPWGLRDQSSTSTPQQTTPRTGMHVLLLLRTVKRGAALGLGLGWVDRSPKAEPLKAGPREEGMVEMGNCQGIYGQPPSYCWMEGTFFTPSLSQAYRVAHSAMGHVGRDVMCSEESSVPDACLRCSRGRWALGKKSAGRSVIPQLAAALPSTVATSHNRHSELVTNKYIAGQMLSCTSTKASAQPWCVATASGVRRREMPTWPGATWKSLNELRTVPRCQPGPQLFLLKQWPEGSLNSSKRPRSQGQDDGKEIVLAKGGTEGYENRMQCASLLDFESNRNRS